MPSGEKSNTYLHPPLPPVIVHILKRRCGSVSSLSSQTVFESRPPTCTTFVPAFTFSDGFSQCRPSRDVAYAVCRRYPAMYHILNSWSLGSNQTPSLNGIAIGPLRSVSQGWSALRIGLPVWISAR